MAAPHVAVSFAPRPRERAIIIERLSPLADIAILPELDGAGQRMAALDAAAVLFTWNVPRELTGDDFAHLEHVRLIQTLSAGVDHLPFAQFPAQATIASNAGAYADPMAEHVLAMTLALQKRLLAEQQKLASGIFDQSIPNRRMRGATAAIIGFGGIGQATARLLRAFGAEIIAINQSGQTDESVLWAGTLADLERALREADIVVLSLPLTRQTRNLIGARELGWMKPDAILINVARGALIEEGALYEHLSAHPQFLAGIDTWWQERFSGRPFHLNYPFFTLPNLLGSPHNSGTVSGIMAEATQHATENIARFLMGERMRGIVRRDDYVTN
jgi:glycerate dehydrogenase